jgi:hypothetical protein
MLAAAQPRRAAAELWRRRRQGQGCPRSDPRPTGQGGAASAWGDGCRQAGDGRATSKEVAAHDDDSVGAGRGGTSARSKQREGRAAVAGGAELARGGGGGQRKGRGGRRM